MFQDYTKTRVQFCACYTVVGLEDQSQILSKAQSELLFCLSQVYLKEEESCLLLFETVLYFRN